MTSQIRSIDEVRGWFDRCGISVTEWAEQNGFSPSTVYALLGGRCRGHRGEGHRVAVALRLKLGASEDDQVLMRLPGRANQLSGQRGGRWP